MNVQLGNEVIPHASANVVEMYFESLTLVILLDNLRSQNIFISLGNT
jgi:hypothetical protein